MDHTQQSHFGLLSRDNLSDEPINEFVATVTAPKLSVRVSRIAPSGPMAGMEWVMPTAVILYIAKSYFETFLKEAGKDHYALVKRGLSGLWQEYLSPNKKVTFRLVGTAGKIDPNQRYSHAFSIYTPTLDGVDRIKFLFDETCQSDAFNAYVQAILSALEDYHAHSSNSVLHQAIEASGGRTPPFLVRYNSDPAN